MSETLTVPAQLAEIRAQLCLDQHLAAEALGAHRNSVSGWDGGKVSPSIRYAIAYADLLGYRIVVYRNGFLVADLVGVLPRLAELRRAAGLTQAQVGRQLRVGAHAVSWLEQHAGPSSWFAVAERHLRACGYEVALDRAVEAVAA